MNLETANRLVERVLMLIYLRYFFSSVCHAHGGQPLYLFLSFFSFFSFYFTFIVRFLYFYSFSLCHIMRM